MTTTTIQWNDARTNPPPTGTLVRVIYADGHECNAEWAGGKIWYPENSPVYRYVEVLKWQPLEVESVR